MNESQKTHRSFQQEIHNIETTIVALETQRAALGDLVVDTALGLLRERLATLIQPDQAHDERKRVTVLFADVSGYTALSENLDPEDVAAIMNRLFQTVTAEIHRYGGAIDNISVTSAVPEPESYVMLLAGMGLIGAVARRRQGKASVA